MQEAKSNICAAAAGGEGKSREGAWSAWRGQRDCCGPWRAAQPRGGAALATGGLKCPAAREGAAAPAARGGASPPRLHGVAPLAAGVRRRPMGWLLERAGRR